MWKIWYDWSIQIEDYIKKLKIKRNKRVQQDWNFVKLLFMNEKFEKEKLMVFKK